MSDRMLGTSAWKQSHWSGDVTDGGVCPRGSLGAWLRQDALLGQNHCGSGLGRKRKVVDWSSPTPKENFHGALGEGVKINISAPRKARRLPNRPIPSFVNTRHPVVPSSRPLANPEPKAIPNWHFTIPSGDSISIRSRLPYGIFIRNDVSLGNSSLKSTKA